jgi:hypothetical protein
MFNIFEGARRVALLVVGLSMIGGVVAAWNAEPRVELRYNVSFYGATPTKAENCAYEDGEYTDPRQLPGGQTYYLEICFSSSRADNGEVLVPYAPTTDGRVFMEDRYSDEVKNYMRATAGKFAPSTADLDDAKAEYWKQTFTKRLSVIGYTLLGVMLFWLAVSAMGWIARGFFGIPAGADHK